MIGVIQESKNITNFFLFLLLSGGKLLESRASRLAPEEEIILPFFKIKFHTNQTRKNGVVAPYILLYALHIRDRSASLTAALFLVENTLYQLGI